MTTYVLLGWFSPLTRSHKEVIEYLDGMGDVTVGPTSFYHDDEEVLTRTRPFSHEERLEMLKPLEVDTISSYKFISPYKNYVYLFSRPREKLINDVQESVPEDSIFFTREPGQAFLLQLMGFNVEYEKRTGLSGTIVRDLIYEEIERDELTGWEEFVAPGVDEIIRRPDTWERLEELCYKADETLKFGFKVPMKGLW